MSFLAVKQDVLVSVAPGRLGFEKGKALVAKAMSKL